MAATPENMEDARSRSNDRWHSRMRTSVKNLEISIPCNRALDFEYHGSKFQGTLMLPDSGTTSARGQMTVMEVHQPIPWLRNGETYVLAPKGSHEGRY